MPTRLPFTQIDAFTSRPFTGNPAAVMPLQRWLDDEVLQAIAAENNLAETAFIVPRSDAGEADFDLRWFTPSVEVALCGHATLASGHLVLAAVPQMERVRFSTRKAGVLTVARQPEGYAMELPAWPAETRIEGETAASVAAALGAAPDEIWVRGSDYVVAVFASAADIRALRPDFRAIAGLKIGHDLLVIATAPGSGDASGAEVVSRAFAPEAGIDEDPVTGSAHAIITPYWAKRLGKPYFTAYQASARGGHLGCRLAGDKVELTGTCVTVIEGQFVLAD
jgi:PhzF family phenazine biosynthesis protein